MELKPLADIVAFLPPLPEMDAVRRALAAISIPDPSYEWNSASKYSTLDNRVVPEAEVEGALAAAEEAAHQSVARFFAAVRTATRAAYTSERHTAALLWIEEGEHAEADGALERARACFEAAAKLEAESKDRAIQILAIRRLARATLGLGNAVDAYWLYRRSAEISADSGDVVGDMIARTGTGNALTAQDRLAEARACYVDALSLADGAGEDRALDVPKGHILMNLTRLCMRAGDLEEAHQWLEQAGRIWARFPESADYVLWVHMRGVLATDEGQWAEARALLEEALGLPLPPSLRAGFTLDLAEVLMADGEPRRALQLAREAESIALQSGTAPVMLVRIYRGLGNIARDSNEDGVVFYEKALDIAQKHNLRQQEAETMLQYAVLRARIGGVEEATDYLETAIGIFQELGLSRDHERGAAILRDMVETSS